MTHPEPQLRDLVDLYMAAEEISDEARALFHRLLEHDEQALALIAALQGMARDARIEIGSRHWTLSAFELHRDTDRLLAAELETWQAAKDVLDPDGEMGVDPQALLSILGARIARGEGDLERLRAVREKLETQQCQRPG